MTSPQNILNKDDEATLGSSEVNANGLKYHIDTFPSSDFYGDGLIVEGWCFNEDDEKPPCVFIELLELEDSLNNATLKHSCIVHAARYPRADVANAFVDQCKILEPGFMAHYLITKSTSYSVKLYAQRDSSEPMLLHSQVVNVKKPVQNFQKFECAKQQFFKEIKINDFEIFFDLPEGFESLGKNVYIFGWCRRYDGQKISSLRARVEDKVFDLNFGRARNDVYLQLMQRPGTLFCGFEGVIELPKFPSTVTFEAEMLGNWIELARKTVNKKSYLKLIRTIIRKSFEHLPQTSSSDAADRLHSELSDELSSPQSELQSRAANKNIVSKFRAEVSRVLNNFIQAVCPLSYGNFYQYQPKELVPESFPNPSAVAAAILPKITIVTPSYNQGIFLKQTMNSVLSQRGVRLDYIVMDGGSTDDSVEIIRSQEKKLLFWTSQKDNGQSEAILNGLKRAQCLDSDILAYLNSDDVILPGTLRFVAEYFYRNPEVDVVYGYRIIIDPEGKETGRWFTPRHNAELLKYVDLIPQETTFWRKRIYDRVGGIDPNFRFAMDWDLFVRFSEAGAIMKRVPYFLGCFRMQQDSKTSQQSQTIGEVESTRIRRRIHGRHVPWHESQKKFNFAHIQGKILSFLWSKGIKY